MKTVQYRYELEITLYRTPSIYYQNFKTFYTLVAKRHTETDGSRSTNLVDVKKEKKNTTILVEEKQKGDAKKDENLVE